MQNESKEFVKKLFGFSMGPIFSAILGFISTPIVTWFIAPSEFGKVSMYTLALQILSIISISGFDQAFIREYNKYKNKTDYLFLNTILVPLSLSVIFASIAIIFSKQLSYFLFASYKPTIIIILSLTLILSTIENFYLSLIRMQEKAKLYSFFSVFTRAVSLPILILLLIYIEKSFEMIIISNFIAIFIRLILLFVINKKYISFNFNKVDMSFIKQMFYFGIPFVPAALLSWLFNSLDKTFLRIFTNFSEIGLYAVSFKFVIVLNILKSSFTTFWVPVSYRWYESGEKGVKFYKVSQYLLSIMTLIIAVIIYCRYLIVKILPPTYFSSTKIFPFLLLIPFMITISETTVMGINFKKKTKYHFWISLITLIINFIGNYFLVRDYKAVGAAISTGISYIAFFWLRTYFSMKVWHKFPISRYIINILIILIYDFYILFYQSYLIETTFLIVILVYNYRTFTELFKRLK